jgi:predicted pyridoxine 5'-phosphate oxidase superfamily flavin-nucleotide-binding protein
LIVDAPVDDRIAAPFHAGELRAQALAGVAPRRPGTVPIRARLPEQHRAFFPLLPFLCVAVTDGQGWPLATLLEGPPGFAAAPDDAHLRIAALPGAHDPARPFLVAGAPAGLLGIELATRRRNRANGIVEDVDADGFTVGIRQSFGNCPRYIDVRSLAPAARVRGPVAAFGAALPDRARALLARGTRMFVATGSGASAAADDAAAGLDISHRGGPAGFVRVDGNTLVVPDYAGNRYYNTLGNMVADPRAAIVLFDEASGDVLQLQGEAAIDWTAADPAADPPVERSWRFTVRRGWLRPGAFGLGAADGFTPGAASTTASAGPAARPA